MKAKDFALIVKGYVKGLNPEQYVSGLEYDGSSIIKGKLIETERFIISGKVDGREEKEVYVSGIEGQVLPTQFNRGLLNLFAERLAKKHSNPEISFKIGYAKSNWVNGNCYEARSTNGNFLEDESVKPALDSVLKASDLAIGTANAELERLMRTSRAVEELLKTAEKV